MQYPYLLLDAGGTLVFPDQELMAQSLADEGCTVDPERLYEAHFHLLHEYDVRLRKNPAPLILPLSEFFTDLMVYAGATTDSAERAVAKLVVRHEDVSLWTYTKPWVAETLETLKQAGVRMSVISNSDGRVFSQLEACGVTPYLEAVFDSGIVGVEKPGAGIFEHALKELGLAPEDALYVGDNYYCDVVGANGAGIGVVHLDPLGRYADWPGTHIRDIRALPGVIAELRNGSGGFDLFPQLKK